MATRSRNWFVVIWVGADRFPNRKVSHPLTEDSARALYRDLSELGVRRPGIGGADLLRSWGRHGSTIVDSVRFG